MLVYCVYESFKKGAEFWKQETAEKLEKEQNQTTDNLLADPVSSGNDPLVNPSSGERSDQDKISSNGYEW